MTLADLVPPRLVHVEPAPGRRSRTAAEPVAASTTAKPVSGASVSHGAVTIP